MARSRRSKSSRSSSSRKKKSGRTRTRKTKARKKARARKAPAKRRVSKRRNAKKAAVKKPAKKPAKTASARKAPAKRTPDFDEEGVTAEMALALKEDPDDLSVEEQRYTHTSPAFEVSLGRMEYSVYENDDTAEAEALAYVESMLRDEPELFNQDWLMGHIDEDALSKWVYDAEMESEYAREIAEDDPDRFWDEAEHWGIDRPGDPDEERSYGPTRGEDVPEEAIEALQEAMAKDRAKDPMGYLNEIYDREEATKKAMEVAGIDIDAAARDAVSTDGWPHFLATYDGNYETTPGGFVYFRTN